MDKQTKKILIIGDHLGPAGAQRQLLYFLKDLNRLIFDISLFLFNKTGEGLKEVPSDVKIYYSYIEDLDHNKGGRPIRTTIRMIKIFFILFKLQKSEKFDFIYGNLFGPNVLISALSLLLNSKSGFKSVISVVANPNMDVPLKIKLMKFFYKKTDLVLSCATGLSEMLVRDYNISNNKLAVVFNAVNPDFIKLRALEYVSHPWFDEDIPILISVAHLRPQKGYTYLLEAFKLVQETVKARLIIIGDGAERSKLENISKELGISDDVDFAGVIQNTNKFVAKSTIFVLPSLWEGLATVLLESAIVKTPIIGTNAPFGTIDVIHDQKTGFLVPIKDAEMLARRIIQLIQDKDLQRYFSANAYKHVLQNFADKSVTKKFEQKLLSL